MADQKSRGGQKSVTAPEGQQGQNRDVRADTGGKHGQRDMAEDTQRGKQSEHGGYDQHLKEKGNG